MYLVLSALQEVILPLIFLAFCGLAAAPDSIGVTFSVVV